MAITTSITNSFKAGMLAGTYNVSTNTFKLALYTSSASIGPSTTAYTATGECSGTNYTAGGVTLAGAAIWTDSNTVGIDFTDPTFTNISVSDIRGFMIYDTSAANASVMTYDFGSASSITTSNYTLVFPAAAAATGLIRFEG